MKRLVKKLSYTKTKKQDTSAEGHENLDQLKWRFALENSNVGLWDWNASTNEIPDFPLANYNFTTS